MGSEGDDDRPDTDGERREAETTVPGVTYDEQESRKHIAETGEPVRDDLGNADGAS